MTRVAREAARRRPVLGRALAGLLVGCQPSAPVLSPAAPWSPGARVWPRAAESMSARPGVLVLAPARSRAQAQRAVQAFFEAVRHESIGELSAWLADDATISSGPGATSDSIAKVWGARFKQLDYGVDGGRRPYRADAVGVFTRGELEALERGYQLAPAGDELLAVVETRERERSAGPRHFGRRLEFVLGPVADGYRIRRMYEDFQTP